MIQLEIHFHGLKFSWKQFHQANLDLAILLKEFCLKNNLLFGIVGARVNDSQIEKEFYLKNLDKMVGNLFLMKNIEKEFI